MIDDPSDLRISDRRATRMIGAEIAKKLLRILVAVVLLYYVFSYINRQGFISAIGGANASLVCLAFLAAFVVQWIVSYRLKRLTDVQGFNFSTLLVFEVNLAGRFYGLFLPGGNITALLIRIFKLAKEQSHIAGIVVSLFGDRLVATLSLCILGVLFWVLAQPQADRLWLVVFVFATIACLAPTYVLFIRSLSPEPGRIAQLLKRLSPTRWGKFLHLLQRSRLAGGEVLISSLLLSVIAHLVGTISYWLIAQSLDMALSLHTIAWIRSGMMLVTLLPFTIAGLGVREVAALVLLQHHGVESEVSIAFSMLVFATIFVGVSLIGGLTEGWRLVSSKGP